MGKIFFLKIILIWILLPIWQKTLAKMFIWWFVLFKKYVCVPIENINKFQWNVCLMVFSTTFNNIAVILWQSVLLVEETGGPGENHRPISSHW
jgi:hypothetical protein